MKLKLLIPLFISALTLGACNSNSKKPSESKNESESQNDSESIIEESESEESEVKRVEKDVSVKLGGLFNKDKSYPLTFSFDSDFFFNDATEFNKDLALLSFGLSMSVGNTTDINAFYQTVGFDDIACFGYDHEPTTNSIAYTIAKLTVDGQNIYSLAVRGTEYGSEWSNNFDLVREGDHVGFVAKAQEALADLKNYLAGDESDFRLWITGYSRGGGVSNVLSYLILSEDNPIIEKEKMFVYTFEAPRGLCKEHAIAFENVFNLYNRNDLVAYLAPESYGLYRCGIDIDIYSEHVQSYLTKFDPLIILPEFVEDSSYYTTEDEFMAYVLKIFEPHSESDADDQKNIKTRANYYNYFQQSVMYLVSLIFTLSDSTLNKIKDKIASLDALQKAMLLATDGLYNVVKPILDEDGYEYNDEELRTNLNAIGAELLPTCTELLMILLNEKTQNLARIINMHYPETVYVLLEKYQ